MLLAAINSLGQDLRSKSLIGRLYHLANYYYLIHIENETCRTSPVQLVKVMCLELCKLTVDAAGRIFRTFHTTSRLHGPRLFLQVCLRVKTFLRS